MAAEEEDYLLRMLQELRQFVSRVVRLRDAGSVEEALLAVVHARERLFGRPSPEFAKLPVDDQLAMLAKGERPDIARAKCVTYATILKEAAFIYQVQAEPALASSAFQLALYIQLQVAVQSPDDYGELREGIDDLVRRLDPETLYPPVKLLLSQLPA